MTQYRRKPALVEATQWFRNGDHPADESTPINRPGGSSTTLTEGKIVKHYHAGIPGDRVCPECGNVFHRHGLIEGLNGEQETVHPGDYICTNTKGDFYLRRQKEFEGLFEPYDGDRDGIKGETVELEATQSEIDLEDLAARVKAIEDHFTGLANSDPSNLKTLRSRDLALPQPVTPDPGKVQS